MSKKVSQEGILVSGKRKSATAVAYLKKGSGKVTVNKQPIEVFTSEMYALRIQEPLLLAGEVVSGVDIAVTTKGGGYAGQADACRLAIAKALAAHKESLEQVFADYDRTLLVADVRRKEPKKPNTRGRARAKRQKSYR
jgi:small subunit ribosomal protein S9